MNANLLAVLFVLVSTTLTHTVNAAPYAPYPSPYYQAPQTESSAPATIVKTGINKLTAFIRNGGAQNPEQARTFLETEVAPYFDFNYMTRWAAGYESSIWPRAKSLSAISATWCFRSRWQSGSIRYR